MSLESSQLGREITKLDWSELRPWGSARCLPAMAIAIGLAFHFHVPPAGLIAAGGTLAVGFSSFRRLQESRLLPMLLTTFGMGFAATLGTLAGATAIVSALGAGLMGFLYGLALAFSESASWIGLQCVIAFMVAGAFPAHGWHALLRGGLVSAGGLLQIIMILALSPGMKNLSFSEDLRRCDLGNFSRLLRDHIWPTTLRQINHQRPIMRYAIRLSVTLTLAVIASHRLNQLNSYWLPMTTLLVMKPDFYRTYTSSLSRVLGTFLGVILASLITHILHPHPLVLVILVIVFAWTCFAGQKVNYAAFSCVLTAWIVFLVAIAGLPEKTVTANRLLDTALGSLLALGSRAIGPRWENLHGETEKPAASP